MPRMNYNYAFVFYDIGEGRVHKVFKICKKYLHHHQMSVFRGPITPSNLIKLKAEINKVIDDTVDYVSIIKLLNQNTFDEESLGKKDCSSDSDFI